MASSHESALEDWSRFKRTLPFVEHDENVNKLPYAASYAVGFGHSTSMLHFCSKA